MKMEIVHPRLLATVVTGALGLAAFSGDNALRANNAAIRENAEAHVYDLVGRHHRAALLHTEAKAHETARGNDLAIAGLELAGAGILAGIALWAGASISGEDKPRQRTLGQSVGKVR